MNQPEEVYSYTVWRYGIAENSEDPSKVACKFHGEIHIPAGLPVDATKRLVGVRRVVERRFAPPWVVEEVARTITGTYQR